MTEKNCQSDQLHQEKTGLKLITPHFLTTKAKKDYTNYVKEQIAVLKSQRGIPRTTESKP